MSDLTERTLKEGYDIQARQQKRITELEGIADARMHRIDELEAALTKVHGIIAEYWGPCPGSVETLLTIRDAIGAKGWLPNVDYLPRLLATAETVTADNIVKINDSAETLHCYGHSSYVETSVQPKVPAHRERPHDYESPTCWCGEHNYQSKIEAK